MSMEEKARTETSLMVKQPEGGAIALADMFTDQFDQFEKVANLMASGRCTVPSHLKDNPGDCFAIICQSMQWGMNPWPVAQKTHLVQGKLGYESQLINAIVQASGVTTGMFHDEYVGDWSKILGKFEWKKSSKTGKRYQVPAWTPKDEEGLGIVLTATLTGEDEPRKLELLMVQATVRNSTLWASDPKQQLYYLAVKRWARKYCPQVIQGVYSRDELSEIDSEPRIKNVTPQEDARTATETLADELEGVQDPEEGKAAQNGVIAKTEQVLEAFAKQGITKEMLWAKLDAGPDYELNEDDIEELRALYAATENEYVLVAREIGVPDGVLLDFLRATHGNYRFHIEDNFHELSDEQLVQMIQDAETIREVVADWIDEQNAG